ncbi:hypothetical protein OBBRIDRAFT_886945 [Obba rivulosa]|uniref:DUF1793-domain-containing protein n=1 Tax=Obba rivulosa TaxID=1052685 RepID=A0A8E2AW26_9APHY|nr:hypothetical protein OBBRIDRAFT_886945 [Obba rivulosa]
MQTHFRVLCYQQPALNAMRRVSTSSLILTAVYLVQSLHVLAGQSFWPAAVPLAVRSPYFNCWLPTGQGTNPTARWPQFWNFPSGSNGVDNLGWEGLARVDGTTYQWLGDWSSESNHGFNPAQLTNIQITPTRTIFQVEAGPMSLNITYLTPIEPSDWVRQCIPFSYVALEAASTDGKPHDFQVYADISAEWLSGDRTSDAAWNTTMTGNVIYHEISLNHPTPFKEISGQANDGIMFHAMTNAMTNGASSTYHTNSDATCRGQFLNYGALTNGLNTVFGSILSSATPVFALAVDLGPISSTFSPIPNGEAQLRSPYFITEFATPTDVISEFLSDYDTANQRAQALDQKILRDASNISTEYADLVSLAARQAFGGIDITISNGTDGHWNTSDIMIFMKDIGNTRRVNPVEVLYQAFPTFLYLNASFGKPLLAPLFEYQDSPQFTLQYAAADLGNSYPIASGDNASHSQGIEQTGNMLIMTLAHARISGDGSLISQHYGLLKSWANYLINNILFPTSAQQSADLENIVNSTNLSVKGIIGIRAMAEMSEAFGQAGDATFYGSQAMALITEWESLALDSDRQHLLLDYADDTSWGLMYNLYADRLLGFNLVNSSIYAAQTTFYEALPVSRFGLEINSARTSSGESAWLLFTAATASVSNWTKSMISMAWSRASFNQTPEVWSTDYDIFEGTITGGSASPGQGAMFAPLVLSIPNTTILFPVLTGPNAPTHKSTNTAAIVGGTVGGICVVGLVIFAAVLARQRSHIPLRRGLLGRTKDLTRKVDPFPLNVNPTESVFTSVSGEIGRKPPSQPHRPRTVVTASTVPEVPSPQDVPGGDPEQSGLSSSRSAMEELRNEMTILRRVLLSVRTDITAPPPVYEG